MTMKTPRDFEYQVPIKIDPSKDPKHLNFTIFHENGQKVVVRYLYTLENDTLKLCGIFNGRSMPRPQSFDTAKGDAHLIVLKRAMVALGQSGN
jgi:uncharacterized protein (TIGR03067 family)